MQADESREIVDRLTGIGLEDREAQLYVDLLLHGGSRASDAASRVKLKRTETYRALEALMKRGFVTAQLTRPVVYEAVAPDVVFNDLLASHEQRKSEMEDLRERVAEVAARAKRDQAEGDERYAYRIIQGRRSIHSTLETMMRGAREEQWTVTSHITPAIIASPVRAWQVTMRRAQEGIRMRFLLRETPGLDRALAPIMEYANVEVRYGDMPRGVRFTLVDRREIAHWLVSEPVAGVDARDDIAMWTTAADFIATQATLFEALWARGREVVRPRAH